MAGHKDLEYNFEIALIHADAAGKAGPINSGAHETETTHTVFVLLCTTCYSNQALAAWLEGSS